MNGEGARRVERLLGPVRTRAGAPAVPYRATLVPPINCWYWNGTPDTFRELAPRLPKLINSGYGPGLAENNDY